MTKETLRSNEEASETGTPLTIHVVSGHLVIAVSSFLRHSSFGIRHFHSSQRRFNNDSEDAGQ
jgi:hypothetical protein